MAETHPTGPSARIILDSIGPDGHRVTTMEVVMHRFVLAEFNTHRVFSRNSASSRAIPVAKQIERVRKDPAIPVSWPKEQKGMQGGEELDGHVLAIAKGEWLLERDSAVFRASRLAELGVHKSVINRLLEPFLWHTVIVTSTEWDNFFALRCSPMAQPEMRAAAEKMRKALQGSEPGLLDDECWHLPFVDGDRYDESEDDLTMDSAKDVSAARCARVSYLTHDGKRDISADLKLAERLKHPGEGSPPHASPFEHVCRPLRAGEKQVGNLTGWRQYRHEIWPV